MKRNRYLQNASGMELTMPNGITLTQQYEPQRDLLTSMAYTRGETTVAERTYSYDTLGRPTTRTETREGNSARSDSFTHNDRSELTAATLGNAAYAYAYDNIGNRKSAQENAEEATIYDANNLNQYTAVGEFVPEFDADGNQTKVQTSTGIWNVTYDAENRPTVFSRANDDGTTTQVTCAYDYMGRRATKKVETLTTNAETGESISAINLNHAYIYRGYLQITCFDLQPVPYPCLWHIAWDPSQPVATRPLAIQMNSTWYCYGWDLTKNICEFFSTEGTILTTYRYTPYGAVTAEGSVTQPIQWSSEFYDNELGLVYYNYRHYNPEDGKWVCRDSIAEEGGWNLFAFVNNNGVTNIDSLGLKKCFTYNFGPLECPSSKGSLTGAGWAFDWSTSTTLTVCYEKYKISGNFSFSGEVGATIGIATQKSKWGYTLFAMLGVRGFAAIAGTASVEGAIDPKTCNASLEVKANTNVTLGLEGGALARVFKNNKLKSEVGVGARASVSAEAGASVRCENSDCEFQFYAQMNDSVSYSVFANFGWFDLSYEGEKRIDMLKDLSIESEPYEFKIPRVNA